jgi:hypothetical protein
LECDERLWKGHIIAAPKIKVDQGLHEGCAVALWKGWIISVCRFGPYGIGFTQGCAIRNSARTTAADLATKPDRKGQADERTSST